MVGSPPPCLAAMMMARLSLLHSLPRLASMAPFLCLIVAQWECPDMAAPCCASCAPRRGRSTRASPSLNLATPRARHQHFTLFSAGKERRRSRLGVLVAKPRAAESARADFALHLFELAEQLPIAIVHAAAIFLLIQLAGTLPGALRAGRQVQTVAGVAEMAPADRVVPVRPTGG